MGRILVFGIIFVFVGLVVMLLFEVLAILFIAALVGAVVLAVVWTVIKLSGMFKGNDDEHIEEKTAFKGDDDKHIEEMVEEELQGMKKSTEVWRKDRGDIGSHHGRDRAYRNVQGR